MAPQATTTDSLLTKPDQELLQLGPGFFTFLARELAVVTEDVWAEGSIAGVGSTSPTISSLALNLTVKLDGEEVASFQVSTSDRYGEIVWWVTFLGTMSRSRDFTTTREAQAWILDNALAEILAIIED